MVLEAIWPVEESAMKPPPIFSDSSKTDARSEVAKPVVEAKRVELSGDISRHAVVPEGHAGFVVDTMDDPTRMRFGYFQTGSLIRALRKAPSMHFRLTLRRPEVTLTTNSIPLDGLAEAIRSLERCQNGKP